LVDIRGRLFENEGPKVRDLGDCFVSAGVEGGGEVYLLADCYKKDSISKNNITVFPVSYIWSRASKMLGQFIRSDNVS
jgi:hypothetical protein